ncbi:MAG: DNA damage-inducible protein D [Candidatus Pacebacteria bacterium]|jgi:DNA-damage-inducible protein D|nr:DNA damage-inducible protein D [Candidatus Paceibacterota bacterium]MBT3512280.1 DNA damage-inducible protein D [Candidatus Paceibacterota bacterium]MBT4004526.1 DNA damage-inducible protein D [Candidatus Paceibacterota bacterium]MBT4358858.1 DNA damage-inducible protein D [Candidatus Paceibacterota bacterium]MBT4681193.1 DNA damage-inducible protein D [Candidatus Paceibacterota bacterium]
MKNIQIDIFEKIKKTNGYQQEYWSARQLSKVLSYSEYRHFTPVITKAKKSCKNADQSIKKHFEDVLDMVEIGSNVSRQITDMNLSRYACYLIMQNADPSKEIVALGQTYFAIQTRKQEIQSQSIEDQKRVFLREEVTAHNKHLAQTASQAGVKKYGVFTNYGYVGLYGGLKSKEIAKKKKIKKSQKILDHMGSEELAANLFRATQADAKLKRDNIQGEAKANQAHFKVGKKVRQTIKDLDGTMPENLQSTDSIARAKKRLKKKESKRLD